MPSKVTAARASLVGSTLAAFSLLVACSSDESPSSTFVSAFCDRLTPCCQPTPGSQGTPGSGCKTFYSLFGGSSFDSAKGDACLAEIDAHRAQPAFCSQVSALAPSCDQAFKKNTGKKTLGEPCTKRSECAPSSEGDVTCDPAGSSATATCKLRLPGKSGDTPCAGTRRGLATSFSGGSDANRAYVCDVATGSWCNVKSGACDQTRAIGDDCTGATESCAAGAECSFSTKKCAATTVPPGASVDPSLLLVCSSSD